eukprot:6580162-Lingulodinium_polyedra.AAC.1
MSPTAWGLLFQSAPTKQGGPELTAASNAAFQTFTFLGWEIPRPDQKYAATMATGPSLPVLTTTWATRPSRGQVLSRPCQDLMVMCFRVSTATPPSVECLSPLVAGDAHKFQPFLSQKALALASLAPL